MMKKKEPNTPPRFAVYRHNLVIKDSQIITRQFIVFSDEYGRIRFTDFHRYLYSPLRPVRSISDDGNNRIYFIVKFLNYAFFSAGIHALNDITVDIVKDFCRLYGMCELPDDDKEMIPRKKATVERCVNCVMDFLINLISDQKGRCRLKRSELYIKKDFRDKYGSVHEKNIPAFDVCYLDSADNPIFRDMPDKAFNFIMSHILSERRDLLGLVMHSAFAGLRPSEACNVRRPDSPLGPGILIDEADGRVTGIRIDLSREVCLRSDLKSVGRIKKERIQPVPWLFQEAYMEAYRIYMRYLNGRNYEADYGPFNINSQGMAYTYPLYYLRFREMIEDEIIPEFLQSGDEELVLYGRILQEHAISPHIFRHWYTVQLVLSGVSDPHTLMAYRGDRSVESAMTYLKNKSELERKFRKVNDQTFAYMLWRSEVTHDRP